MLHRLVPAAALLAALALPAAGAGEGTPPIDRAPVVFAGVQEGGLLAPGGRITADVPGAPDGVELWFAPESRDAAPVLVGVDRDGTAPTFGPDCAGGCSISDEYSFDADALRSALPVDETWGTLSLRRVGDAAPLLTRRVYWDATPPIARFTTPQFDSHYKKNGWEIVAHSLDQDIVSIVVTWSLGVPKRFTPLYEQHTLGYTLGNDGHASCAPTASMAAMDWLSNPYLGNLIPTSICGSDKVCWVGLMGLAMGTTGSNGTSGAGLEQGLNTWLAASGYVGSVDHHVAVMTPQQMVELANEPGAVVLGIHNIPADTAMGATFGHVVVLDNAVPGVNGTAIVTIMDENQEPNPGGATQGAYRSFVMHQDGSINWSSAYTTYYDPPSGKLQFDEYAHVEAYLFGNLASPLALLTAPARPGGTVAGQLQPGGHTWVGRFVPPPGQTGPFLLTTETTDASGHTLRDVQYVGGDS